MNDKNEKKKIYEKGWFCTLMLFLFFPIGVFLLWKYPRKHKILNVILTAVFGFVFLIVTVAMFSPSEPIEETSRQNIAKTISPTPTSADNVVATEPTKSVETPTPTATVEPIPEQVPEQTAEPKTETLKTSVEELRTLFVNYSNSRNGNVKNRLLKEDSNHSSKIAAVIRFSVVFTAKCLPFKSPAITLVLLKRRPDVQREFSVVS